MAAEPHLDDTSTLAIQPPRVNIFARPATAPVDEGGAGAELVGAQRLASPLRRTGLVRFGLAGIALAGLLFVIFASRADRPEGATRTVQPSRVGDLVPRIAPRATRTTRGDRRRDRSRESAPRLRTHRRHSATPTRRPRRADRRPPTAVQPPMASSSQPVTPAPLPPARPAPAAENPKRPVPARVPEGSPPEFM